MITIFTVPKPFIDEHIKIIQKNAISSWLKLEPKCEIILVGDEKGVAETALEFGVKHLAGIKKNEFGTPILSDIFNKAQQAASFDNIAYVNADIILLNDFVEAVKLVKENLFVIAGKRWNLDVKEPLLFKESGWEIKLRERLLKEGTLFTFSAIDYFIFRRGFFKDIPDFALGRSAWDNWLLYEGRKLGAKLIDATAVITAIHQNHSYSHTPWAKKGWVGGPEAKKNLRLAEFSNMLTLRDIDTALTREGEKPTDLSRRFCARLSRFYPWRFVLGLRRRFHEFLYEKFSVKMVNIVLRKHH